MIVTFKLNVVDTDVSELRVDTISKIVDLEVKVDIMKEGKTVYMVEERR